MPFWGGAEKERNQSDNYSWSYDLSKKGTSDKWLEIGAYLAQVVYVLKHLNLVHTILDVSSLKYSWSNCYILNTFYVRSPGLKWAVFAARSQLAWFNQLLCYTFLTILQVHVHHAQAISFVFGHWIRVFSSLQTYDSDSIPLVKHRREDRQCQRECNLSLSDSFAEFKIYHKV